MCNAHCASPLALSLLQVFPTMPTTIPTTLLPNQWLETNHKNEPQKPRSRRNHSNQLKETLEPKGSLQFVQRNEETTAKNHWMLWVLYVFKQLLISLLFSNHFSQVFHVFVSTLSKYVTLDLGSWILDHVHRLHPQFVESCLMDLFPARKSSNHPLAKTTNPGGEAHFVRGPACALTLPSHCPRIVLALPLNYLRICLLAY